jgi:hypothetical protein
MLSLAAVKVGCWIRQHYECLKSSVVVVVESIAMKQTYGFRDYQSIQVRVLRNLGNPVLLPHAVQAVRPGKWKW